MLKSLELNSKVQLMAYQDANTYQVVNTCSDSAYNYYELQCVDFKQRELIGFDVECFSYNQTIFIKCNDLHLFKLKDN